MISEIRRGNTRAFSDLVDSYKDMVFTLSVRMLGNREEAEEVSQDVFIKVFKSRSHVFQAEVEFWALANQDDEVRIRSQGLYEKIINLFELVIIKGIREKEFMDVDTRITAI